MFPALFDTTRCANGHATIGHRQLLALRPAIGRRGHAAAWLAPVESAVVVPAVRGSPACHWNRTEIAQMCNIPIKP